MNKQLKICLTIPQKRKEKGTTLISVSTNHLYFCTKSRHVKQSLRKRWNEKGQLARHSDNRSSDLSNHFKMLKKKITEKKKKWCQQ